jgi:hypothetical protein
MVLKWVHLKQRRYLQMKMFRRIKLSVSELERFRAEFDDYVWIAIDVSRGILSAGDCYMGELRDALLQKRSKPEDIYCVGLNMATGELNYLKTFNRRNPLVGFSGVVDDTTKALVSKKIEYLFGSLPIFEVRRRENEYESRRLTPMLRTARI